MMMTTRAALIAGVSGLELTADEIAFFKSCRPAGTILFARNCGTADQIKRLVADIKSAIGSSDTLVLIDQEGGRVQRLRPPLGRALPPAAAYAQLYSANAEAACHAVRSAARLVAEDLIALGINTNCTPVLDVPVAGAHDIIGDRAFGDTPTQIAALGRAVCEGFQSGGVVPVIKHIPGHGRARTDSHLELPVVTTTRSELEATDFVPFKLLNDQPTAMTAHVVFSDIDRDQPASTSAIVTREVIRGHMGYDGLLMSDDLSMKALAGPMRARAEAVIMAGSDVALHCNGELAEMDAAASGVPTLNGRALARFQRAIHCLDVCQPYDRAAAELIPVSVLAGYAAKTGDRT
jgi:beta-N-acetylhexosaminidase